MIDPRQQSAPCPKGVECGISVRLCFQQDITTGAAVEARAIYVSITTKTTSPLRVVLPAWIHQCLSGDGRRPFQPTREARAAARCVLSKMKVRQESQLQARG